MTAELVRSRSKFWALASAQGVSAAGDFLTLTVLTVRVQGEPGGAIFVSALMVASLVPGIVFGPLFARLFDRFDAATVLKAGLVLQAALTGALMVFFHGPPVALVVMFFLAQAAAVLENPAILTLAPTVRSSTAEVSIVYARLALLRNLGGIAGPLFAGALAVANLSQLALGIDALSCFVLAAVVQVARLAHRKGPPVSRVGVTRSGGVRHLLVSPNGVGAAVWMLAAAILFTAVLPVAQPAFILTDQAMPPEFYGLVLAAYSAGRVTIAGISSALRLPGTARTQLFTATIGMGVVLLATVVVPGQAVIVVGFFLAGAANTQQVLAIRTIVHDGVAPERLPAAFTALGAINNTATLVGVLVGGAVVTISDGTAGLIYAGAGTIATATTIALIQKGRDRTTPLVADAISRR